MSKKRKRCATLPEPERDLTAPSDPTPDLDPVAPTHEWRRMRRIRDRLVRALNVLDHESPRGPIAVEHFIAAVKDIAEVE